jgi:uncharacterized protein (DUF433 family)
MTAPAPTPAVVDIGTLLHSKPGVNGGRVCLAGTGISVRAIASVYNEGLTPEEILRDCYTHVDLPRIYAAITYYLANKAAIDADLEADAALFDQLEAEERAAEGK